MSFQKAGELNNTWIETKIIGQHTIINIPLWRYKIKIVLSNTMDGIEEEDIAVLYNNIDVTDRFVQRKPGTDGAIATTGLNVLKLMALIAAEHGE